MSPVPSLGSESDFVVAALALKFSFDFTLFSCVIT